MPISRAPHGLFAAPLIGAGRLADIFQSGNIFFVDAGVAHAGNGKSPSNAVTSLTTAISNAAREATIYIRPKTTATSSQSYYQEDIVIPITKPGLSIIGAGNPCPSAQTGVQFKPLTLTGNMFDVNAANTTLENMRLTLTGGTAGSKASIVSAITATSTATCSGLVIRGCRFENDKDHPTIESSTVIYGSIALGTTNDTIIEDNIFHNCIGGIVHQLSTGVTHGLTIRRNIFEGLTATRDADILANWDGTGAAGLCIVDNIFADGVPAHSDGGTKRFIKIAGEGVGIIANNFFASNEADSEWGSDGTQVIVPATFFTVGNYSQLGEIVGGT